MGPFRTLQASTPFMSGRLIDDALLTDLISLAYQSRRRVVIKLSHTPKTESENSNSKSYPVELYLLNGRVAYVSSANPYHRLGAILIRRGSITEIELSEVLSSLSGQRLGDALISSGVIDRQELINALKDQALLTLQSALMRHVDLDAIGTLPFNQFNIYTYEESDLPLNLNIDAQALLLEVFRQQDEVSALLKSLPSLTECPKATRSPHESDSPEVAFALQQCGGFTSLKTLIFMNPISALEALKLYKSLLEEDVIKVKGSWKSSRSPLQDQSNEIQGDVKSQTTEAQAEDDGWFDLCFTPDVDL